MNVTQSIFSNKKRFIQALFLSIMMSYQLNALQTTPIQWPEASATQLDNSKYFKSNFLRDTALVHTSLLRDNFTEINFPATDGISLNGLLRAPENPPFSVIFCSGFCPGRKEGLASLLEMLPQSSTLLFFDARGHGKSQGRFYSNIAQYGEHEYKDIIGAILYLAKKNPQPIFIFGTCAGAYHALRALIELNRTDQINSNHIKGLIFDSGFASLSNACTIPDKHFKDKIIPAALMTLYKNDTRAQIKERYIYKISTWLMSKALNILSYFLKPKIEENERKYALNQQITTLSCPIMYIHSEDDSYSSINEVKELAEHTKNKEAWWITEKSEHACHYLKHKVAYCQRLQAFISRLLYEE